MRTTLALLVVTLVSACTNVTGAPTIFPTPEPTLSLPADMLALGITFEPTSPTGKLTQSEALAHASGHLVEGGTLDAYLVRATDPGTAQSDLPVIARDVWVIRISGVRVTGGGVVAPDGSVIVGPTLTHGYVFLDAVTGAFLETAWGP
jgi:hypothetical protein